jgi:hypothetical protein
VDADALIERTATAVAEGYRDLDLTQAAGLLLSTDYDGAPEQLAPLALELRAGEVTPDVDRDGRQRELGMPQVERDPPVFELCRALNERIEHDDEGYVVLETYWLALADRLHTLLGIPVLVCEIEMPIAEQLRRRLGTPAPADPLAGLDVLVALPLDRQRVAAVWREEPSLQGSARVPAQPWELGWNTQLGSDPEVRAGWLPPGAVGACLRDRTGTWHEARTGENVWLCALPQRAGQHDPPVVYRDVEGNDFRLDVEVDGLPGLWPAQAGVAPRRIQRETDVLSYGAEGWYVSVEGFSGFEDTVFRPLPGTLLGRPHGFGIELRHDRWRAVGVCGSLLANLPPASTSRPCPAADHHRPEGRCNAYGIPGARSSRRRLLDRRSPSF